jgi:hypothetical protein
VLKETAVKSVVQAVVEVRRRYMAATGLEGLVTKRRDLTDSAHKLRLADKAAEFGVRSP